MLRRRPSFSYSIFRYRFPRRPDSIRYPHHTHLSDFSVGMTVSFLFHILSASLIFSVHCSSLDVLGFCHLRSTSVVSGDASHIYCLVSPAVMALFLFLQSASRFSHRRPPIFNITGEIKFDFLSPLRNYKYVNCVLREIEVLLSQFPNPIFNFAFLIFHNASS